MEKQAEKKRAFCPHLPPNHYKIEMAALLYFGLFREIGQKVVTDCDIMRVRGGMGGDL